MGASSRRKGARAENDVVNHLRRNGYPHAERRIAGMDDDTGDITGIPGLVIEVKDRQKHDFPAYMRQLTEEMVAAHADAGVVIAKKKGTTNVGEWYAMMPVDLALELLRYYGFGQLLTVTPDRQNGDMKTTPIYDAEWDHINDRWWPAS